ncbi:MAG: glutaredoxin family protein [Limisphaerales bacterium]|jgi:arsenate reductase-like glutaredoxin family protein|tara:strand:- start:1083 stop:1331 length:249 start_codon:yes stop_codon:yes gene_type:complete
MYKPETVRLYIKPLCGWCREVIEWLDSNNISYQVFDVTLDRSAWDIMVDISNQNLAPVIDVDGEVLADFGVTELSKFWEKLG